VTASASRAADQLREWLRLARHASIAGTQEPVAEARAAVAADPELMLAARARLALISEDRGQGSADQRCQSSRVWRAFLEEVLR
jgi:hypothetical protein